MGFLSIFSSGFHFVWWSGTVWAILVEGLLKNNRINYFGPAIQKMLFLSIFSSGGHFIRWSGTVRAILVEGLLRKISRKLF